MASPWGPLPSLFLKCPWGQNWPCPGGSQVEHRNKERKFYNSSSLKLDVLELCYFVRSISLWTSTKFIHMMPQGSGLVLPWGSQDGALGQRRQISKFFFSEIGRGRDLIFCMWHLLGTSTKFVNKMTLVSKLAPPWGSQV